MFGKRWLFYSGKATNFPGDATVSGYIKTNETIPAFTARFGREHPEVELDTVREREPYCYF